MPKATELLTSSNKVIAAFEIVFLYLVSLNVIVLQFDVMSNLYFLNLFTQKQAL